MKFTGFNFRTLIDLKSNNFLFKDLTLHDQTGAHSLHFSGDSNKITVSFSGNHIYDDAGDFIWSYNSGEALNLLVKFNEDKYAIYIDDNQVRNGYKASNYKLEKLILDTNKNGVSFDPSFSSQILDVTGSIAEYFKSGESVDISVINKSPAKINIKSSSSKGRGSELFLYFEGNQTGIVSGNSIRTFSSKDLSSGSLSFSGQLFYLALETNAGSFEIPLKSSRDAVSESINTSLYFGSESQSVYNHAFSGNELSNSFEFYPSYLESSLTASIKKTNSTGERQDVTGIIKFSISGLTGLHTGSFITGIQIGHSGQYSLTPSVSFSSFSGFESISVNQKNLISYATGDSFDLVFSGSCSGMSATAYTKIERIALYTSENPSSKFRAITGVVVNSGGSGLTGGHSISLPDGVLDYPFLYSDSIADSLGYSPVTFNPTFFTSAGRASGLAILSGTQVTGVLILNPGFGYNSGNQLAKMFFHRADGDSLSGDASGVCLLNQSGETVSLLNNWRILASTGFGIEGFFHEDESLYTEQLKTGVFSGDYYLGPIVFGEAARPYLIKVESKNNSSYKPNYLGLSLFESGNESGALKLNLKSINTSYRSNSRSEGFDVPEENFID